MPRKTDELLRRIREQYQAGGLHRRHSDDARQTVDAARLRSMGPRRAGQGTPGRPGLAAPAPTTGSS
jgi:hypothetical protein